MCDACGGNGWVFDATDGDGHDFVRPCARCRPALYDRWRDGHLDPGHTCEECATGKPRKTAPKPLVYNEPPPPPTTEELGIK